MLRFEELHLRAALFQTIRTFFHQQQFLETDTPIRQPVIIPESNIQPLPSGSSYLQTSPELFMKRLLASGCERIYQICKCFRKEERGRRHLEEFTMLEWYRRDADYTDLMEDCEKLLLFLLGNISEFLENEALEERFKLFSDSSFTLTPPWQRIRVCDAFLQWSPVTLKAALKKDVFDEILVEFIEPRLGVGAPVFLIDYPISMASLARKKQGDEACSERFELYIKGVELANGFSELTDPEEQRDRFDSELALCRKNFNHQMTMPDKFLSELGSIGEAAGIAFGLDRLFMLMLGKESIDHAVTFSPEDF